MTDQADRERESRESPITKFEEQRLEDEAEREGTAGEGAAGELQGDPQPDTDES